MTERRMDRTIFDEAFLARLERFKLLAKKGLAGTAAGEHLSRKSGVSPEFLEHRKYQRGDDFRYIDWNIYGRLDKIFIKLFRAEEDLAVHLFLDMSRSMAIGHPPKEHYAKKIAAALAYLGLINFDRVGISAYNDRLIHPRAPRRGKTVFVTLLSYLESLQPEGTTDLFAALNQYTLGGRWRGLFIIISDFFDFGGVTKGLDLLIRGGSDVALIQVLDASELAPRLDGQVLLEDIETGRSRKLTIDRPMLTAHRHLLNRFLEDMRQSCRRRGIAYSLCDTRVPFEDFIFDFLLPEEH